MANEYSFPFADSGGDRAYSDADFAKFYSAIFANGVFINVGGGLQVVDNGVGMNVLLKAGSANIGGRVYFLNADQAFTVPVASSTQDRVDSVVIRLDLSARSINAFYKQADTSVTRNSNTYELQIAKITVPKNANDILQQNIADMRTDKTVCGIASPNDPIDVTTFKAQFEATFNQQLSDNQTQFQAWFTNLKNELDSNQASNLQNQISKNTSDIATKFVHNTGDETINGNKTFTGNIILNTVTTKIISDQTINLMGINFRFYETTLGVNVSYSGDLNQNADGIWHNLGNIPNSITRPVMDNTYNSVQWGGVGGVTFRMGVSILIRFSPDGSISYKMISLKDNDNNGYRTSVSVDGSNSWIK